MVISRRMPEIWIWLELIFFMEMQIPCIRVGMTKIGESRGRISALCFSNYLYLSLHQKEDSLTRFRIYPEIPLLFKGGASWSGSTMWSEVGEVCTWFWMTKIGEVLNNLLAVHWSGMTSGFSLSFDLSMKAKSKIDAALLFEILRVHAQYPWLSISTSGWQRWWRLAIIN